jgi:energy-coupling factor transporter transmembrane protein EcfT
MNLKLLELNNNNITFLLFIIILITLSNKYFNLNLLNTLLISIIVGFIFYIKTKNAYTGAIFGLMCFITLILLHCMIVNKMSLEFFDNGETIDAETDTTETTDTDIATNTDTGTNTNKNNEDKSLVKIDMDYNNEESEYNDITDNDLKNIDDDNSDNDENAPEHFNTKDIDYNSYTPAKAQRETYRLINTVKQLSETIEHLEPTLKKSKKMMKMLNEMKNV